MTKKGTRQQNQMGAGENEKAKKKNMVLIDSFEGNEYLK